MVYNDVSKNSGAVIISSVKIFFKNIQLILGVSLDEESNGYLHLDHDDDLRGYLKVTLYFVNRNPIFSIDNQKRGKFYVPICIHVMGSS